MNRFDDEDFVAVFLGLDVGELVAEVGHLRGEDPRLGEEVVLVLEDLLHPRQIPAQVVLPRELVHPCEVVDPLVIL